jgi:hypothetical protein
MRVHARRDGELHPGYLGGDQRGGERSGVHRSKRENEDWRPSGPIWRR